MGGTGGPGSDRAAAQSGLQGAGLLSGGAAAPSATLTSLGVEGAATPTAGALSGADGAIAAPVGPTSATDTPTPAPGTPEVVAPPSNVYTAPETTSLVAPPATPQTTGFALAGAAPNLGFPTDTTTDTPLGTVGTGDTTGHVPFGTQTDTPPITGNTVIGKPVVADTPVAAKAPEYELDMNAYMAAAAAYNQANAAWGKPGLRPDAFTAMDTKNFMKLKGT